MSKKFTINRIKLDPQVCKVSLHANHNTYPRGALVTGNFGVHNIECKLDVKELKLLGDWFHQLARKAK